MIWLRLMAITSFEFATRCIRVERTSFIDSHIHATA